MAGMNLTFDSPGSNPPDRAFVCSASKAHSQRSDIRKDSWDHRWKGEL